ncbi:MAG: kelch repeat-containing protein [Planctomycetota bacterium]
MNKLLAIPSLVGALAIPVSAQNMSLDKSGGALPGPSTFSIHGAANAPYLLLFSGNEQQTPLPSLGITLDIPDVMVGVCVNLPGFLGVTNGSGNASATLALPDIPALESIVLSFQAIGGTGPYVVSNLVRVTPQRAGTFKPSLELPTVPILGGGVAPAPDGGLLFVGGTGPIAQLYKSRTEQWEAAGLTFGVGLLSQTTGLPDGRVLFTGGIDATTGQPTNAAAIYDPVSQTTTNLTMGIARAGHGASVMGNGRVLITGGFETLSLTDLLATFAAIRASTEIFDPTTNTFSPGPNMLEPRAMHTSTTLTNGEVLVAGGLAVLPIVNIPNVSATAYRFNPNTNSFGLPALMNGGRFMHSAVGLSDGKVLLCGGLTLDLTTFLTTLNIADIVVGTRTDCQLYSRGLIGFGTFTTVNGLQEGRAGAAMAALPGGGALIAGGFRVTLDIPNSTFEATATATADRFSQGPNLIQATGSMAAPRLFPLAVNLPDGTVMVVGGGATDSEIYQR